MYPRRIGTNRTNPYTKPGNFNALKSGLAVFENRHCGAGVPTVSNVPLPPLPADRRRPGPARAAGQRDPVRLRAVRQRPAPPCRLQGPYDFGGEVTQYPHVNER